MDRPKRCRARGWRRWIGSFAACLAAVAIPTASAQVAAGQNRTVVGGSLRYEVIASAPRLNRRLMGPVERWVQGVPAEPVNSFVWDGVGSTPIEGELLLQVNPVQDIGVVQATWKDTHGEWLYIQTRFAHPEHSAGVRIGSSVHEIVSFLKEGVTHNVYLHGDTTAGQPVLPTVFNLLATWGPADVLLNGEPFVNPFEIPAPQWIGHLMVTEGVRQADGSVRTRSGEIYDPSRLSDGEVQTGDLEVHLVFHDERFPRTSNVPPIYSFFYHLVFENVSVQIVQADGLLEIERDGAGDGDDGVRHDRTVDPVRRDELAPFGRR